jgi:hypothetical protein
MPDNPTENPGREGENYDETMSDEPFDDEEELDAEEAERRITQLLLGQRARGSQQLDPEQWHLHAATTLLSAPVVRGAKG